MLDIVFRIRKAPNLGLSLWEAFELSKLFLCKGSHDLSARIFVGMDHNINLSGHQVIGLVAAGYGSCEADGETGDLNDYRAIIMKMHTYRQSSQRIPFDVVTHIARGGIECCIYASCSRSGIHGI